MEEKKLSSDQIRVRGGETKSQIRSALKEATRINELVSKEKLSARDVSPETVALLSQGLLQLYKTASQSGGGQTFARSDEGDQGSGCDYFQGGKMDVGDITD